MSAAQLDELPAEDNAPSKESSGGNLVPALIAIILAPALTVGAMYFLIGLSMASPDARLAMPWLHDSYYDIVNREM